MERCNWPASNPLMIQYHDEEWGVPIHDDRKIFEFMVLDAFQAGLSWSTILNKRENFRKAFSNFEPGIVAKYSEKKIQALLSDAGIVRNELKIRSTIKNAGHFVRIAHEYGSFSEYIWGFVNHKTIINQWADPKQIPVSTKESDAMSKALKKEGFSFVGSTICYSFMQAAGMVNDHTVNCFRHRQLSPRKK
ncbi:MAG: DNA-3-methyladenine glycosylase I [Bacteroidales bacterium]